MVWKCPQCKTDNIDDMIFCASCGAPIPAVLVPKVEPGELEETSPRAARRILLNKGRILEPLEEEAK